LKGVKSGALKISLSFAFSFFIAVLAASALAAAAFDGQRFDVPVGDSQSVGPANAPVTLIEFIDYQ
jgi:hypothetical protein